MDGALSTASPQLSPLPAELELGRDVVAGGDQVLRVGPGLWGTVYRSAEHPACYRLVPIEEAPIEYRLQMRERLDLPRRRNVAPVIATGQTPLMGRIWFYVRYELQPNCSFVDVLAHPDPATRLEYCVRLLRAVQAWRQGLPVGLVPMPADIMFIDSAAQILPVPDALLFGVEQVFDEPSRALFLCPEIVQGREPLLWRPAADSYAVGVAVLGCLAELPAGTDAAALLSSVANGTAFDAQRARTRLPYWVSRVPGSADVVAAVRRTVDPDPAVRSTVDLDALASDLEQLKPGLDPIAAALRIRECGRPGDALALIDDALLAEPSYGLHLLAGDLARIDLHRPLHAIDRYEQAIALDPSRPEAYVRQFDTIALTMSAGWLVMLIEAGGSAPAGLDDRIVRDFGAMSAEDRNEREAALVRFLLSRGRFDRAAEVIYPLLFEGGTYAWWKFELTTAYAEALLGQGRMPEAEAQLRETRARLADALQRQILPDDDVRRHGARLAEVEQRLHHSRAEGKT